ncbi:hypothetical protein BDQ17DRAFT_1336299 [Cyathus striatus]|nr:hypothetical protein BDQ17DRAFT_1336299 [Cyathus striatus]
MFIISLSSGLFFDHQYKLPYDDMQKQTHNMGNNESILEHIDYPNGSTYIVMFPNVEPIRALQRHQTRLENEEIVNRDDNDVTLNNIRPILPIPSSSNAPHVNRTSITLPPSQRSIARVREHNARRLSQQNEYALERRVNELAGFSRSSAPSRRSIETSPLFLAGRKPHVEHLHIPTFDLGEMNRLLMIQLLVLQNSRLAVIMGK